MHIWIRMVRDDSFAAKSPNRGDFVRPDQLAAPQLWGHVGRVKTRTSCLMPWCSGLAPVFSFRLCHYSVSWLLHLHEVESWDSTDISGRLSVHKSSTDMKHAAPRLFSEAAESFCSVNFWISPARVVREHTQLPWHPSPSEGRLCCSFGAMSELKMLQIVPSLFYFTLCRLSGWRWALIQYASMIFSIIFLEKHNPKEIKKHNPEFSA